MAESAVLEEDQVEETLGVVESGVEEVAAQPDDDEGELEITLDGESLNPDSDEDQEQDSEAIRNIRQAHREAKKLAREESRRRQELESEIEKLRGAQKVEEDIGPRPTLESCGYDDEKLEKELEVYIQRKRKKEEIQATRQADNERQAKEWEQTMANYNEAKSKFSSRVRDFEDAEDVAREIFPENAQAMLIHMTDNAPQIVYALGKSPSKAKELASIKDPLKFAFQAGVLSGKLNAKAKTAKPQPEEKVTGKGGSLGVDSQLEKLRAEANRTGNRSKVFAYMRAQQQKK